MASPTTPHVTHHWVRISDADLAFILNGPDGSTDLNPEPAWDWIDEVLDIIEDGLETA